MSEALGRPIRAEATDFDTWLARTGVPLDDYTTRALAAMYDFYDTYGLLGDPLILRAILGREPRSLRQSFADPKAGVPVTAR